MPLTLADFETLEHARLLQLGGMGWSAPLIEGRFAGGYGSGVIGNQDYGLHRWQIRSDFLPDKDSYSAGDDDLPYFTYFFEFFKRHILLGNKPFVIVDPRDDKSYLVRFDRFDVDFPRLTSKFYTFEGINVIEARQGDLLFNEDGSLNTTGETPFPAVNTYSPVLCCGLHCGLTGTGTPHWGALTFASVNSVTVRNGGKSLKILPAGGNGGGVCHGASPNTHYIARIYIYFATLPSANTMLFWTDSGSNQMGVSFKASDSKIYTGKGNLTFGATGVAVTTGQWYYVDFYIDQTSGAKSIQAKVNGTALGTTTSTSVSPVSSLFYGNANNATGEWYITDYILSNTPADYPFGPGQVRRFTAVSDGAHNVTNPGDFKDHLGNNITNSTTDSYSLVNDLPLESVAGDYINQAQDLGGGAEYVEHLLGSPGAEFVPEAPPRGVDLVVAYHQENINPGTAGFRLNDNGTEDIILLFSGVGQTDLRYARKHYADPPTGLGGWKLTGLAGNFNNLKHRFGYSTDGAPDQYFDGVIIEAEFPEEEE
jgi:hypothetical protein